MAYVPPWLDVSPRDFVTAAQGGARIGAELAGQSNEANIAAGRNATALQEAQMRIGAENSAQQNAAQQAAAERELRRWELHQQILHQAAQLQGENQRNQNTVDAENKRAAAALAEREQYGNSMLDIRREGNRIAQEKADNAANKPSPLDLSTVTEHTPGVAPHDEYTVQEPGTPPGSNLNPINWFRSNQGTPPSSLSTTNSNDLLALPPGSTISTNKIPGKPSITTSHKVLLPQTDMPQRIMVQDSNGKKFTIPQDQLKSAKDQGYTEVQ
jgi:hypothetical protein